MSAAKLWLAGKGFGRDQLCDRAIALGNDELLTLSDTFNQLRQVRLGLFKLDGLHRTKLA